MKGREDFVIYFHVLYCNFRAMIAFEELFLGFCLFVCLVFDYP